VTWNESKAETRSSAELYKLYAEAAQKPGAVAAKRGDAEAGVAKGVTKHEALFEFPYLAHAAMEPIDAVVELTEQGATIWTGSQLQTVDQMTAAHVLGLPAEKITINTMLTGGSFGRRAQPDSSMVAEAATAMKALGRAGSVKLVWSREDDMRGGRYRPLTVHRLSGALDAEGKIAAWDQTIATQSILAGSPFEMLIQDGIDSTSVEGARNLPYAIPDFRVSLHTMQAGVPVLWWRSVGHTHTGYTTETFVDELLEKGGQDPVQGRLALLGDAHKRHAAVLQRVAEIADKAGPLPEGRARGVALHESFNSFVAQIAEVSDEGQGYPKVHRVWCAIDCGIAVNPNIVTAQIEGGIGYGLGAALFDEITLGKGGKVVQGNFDTYRSLRIEEMPEVTVSIIDSKEAPTGVGEPGTPPIAAAVGNAWRRLTGKAVRRLPFLPVDGTIG